jgi:hypothetical protein
MQARRQIQEQHERAQVALFLQWFNKRFRSNFVVIDEPNPPEAIIASSRSTRWVEVCTAFLSDAYARDEYSFATPGETHKPSRKRLVDSDQQFAERFVDVVKKKLKKTSYLKSRGKYGPGYLLVPIMYPLFNSESLLSMKQAWNATPVEDIGCFRSIYITHRSSEVLRWTPYANSPPTSQNPGID